MGKIISPKTAYGQSKLIGEWMLEAAYEENGLEYSIAVPFNAYGPGEPPKVINGKLDEGHAHVIPDLFHKVYNSKDGNVKILGEGNQIRCYTFVEDLARGVVELVLNKNAKNEAFNLATKEETSVLELLDIIWEMSGKQENLNVIPTKSFKYDVQKRVPSIEKARRILGFNPDINLYDGLKVVKEWYDSI
jgi:nucleoside-diphosphate-sugar epimerase